MAENEFDFVVSIEELSARKVVKRVDNTHSSGGHDQPVVSTFEAHEKHSTEKVISSTDSSWENKLERLMVEEEEQQGGDPATSHKPKIQTVPPMLRGQKNFEKYFEPRAVSIGPLHHGKPKLQVAEKYKPKLTKKFINNRSADNGKDLYMKIWNNIEMLRDCYDEAVTRNWDNQSLAWMLFLDGCSTLQFIHSFVTNELKIFKIKNDQIAFAQQDLFLLENQLPYQLLKLLMNDDDREVGNQNDEEKKKNKYEESIRTFIRMNVMAPKKYMHQIDVNMEKKQEPAHLLELLQSALIYQPPKKKQSQSKRKKPDPYRNKKKLDCRISYRNVQELKAAGIQLKPSSTSSLKDIDFNSLCFAGYLKLPQLIVDDSTGPLFFNLIAYEMCPDNIQTKYEVTSYVSFLDSLIDNAEDVKDLRSANILENSLGSDLEVAELFNEIGTDLVPNPEAYMKVKAKIQKHYKNKWTTWMAQVCHDHFSSPWTIMAFSAALVALALSGIQTWKSVFPDPGPCDNFCKNMTL
ncbi:UPF0481 protein At3g47200 [Ziziphus jujuba]|uniref:UPF0481 protein At3g47200 n=1 Tax=Ziziphus jujuba TaxID=326968 RepID=A0A6P4A0B0_ZIZJJ|nr:UPF0481 protein At3g47200 [Ziziphus jujuba]